VGQDSSCSAMWRQGDTRRAARRQHAGTPNSYTQCVAVVITDSCGELGAQVCIVKHCLDDGLVVTCVISAEQSG
jgi:hypothetical protein